MVEKWYINYLNPGLTPYPVWDKILSAKATKWNWYYTSVPGKGNMRWDRPERNFQNKTGLVVQSLIVFFEKEYLFFF